MTSIISQELLDKLACPKCKGALVLKLDKLVCEECKLAYAINNGIPVMLIEEATKVA